MIKISEMETVHIRPSIKTQQSGLFVHEEETKSSSKLNSAAICDNLSDSSEGSDFGSISEGSESTLAQKVPHLSCSQNSHSPSKSLLDQGLYLAVLGNEELLCKELLTHGPKPDITLRYENGNSLLHIAAEKGHAKICEILLDYADHQQINMTNHFAEQPLHLACKANQLVIVQLLIRSGADINATDHIGNTPLHIATYMKLDKIASWIINRGPNILIKNKAGKTAEDLADDEISLIFQKYLKRTVVIAGPSFRQDPKLLAIRNQIRYDNEGITPHHFLVLKELGKGSFGEVFLVLKQDTSELFAMKVLQKDKIIKENLVKYAVTERNVLSYIRHPFIVSLKYAFQTSDRLFLFLDYCPGGDLATHLLKEKKFQEPRARVYIAEIVLALEELHKQDIIYRDLKPDNVVLDAEGHAVLTDFGLSKEKVYDNCQATSFCGSLAYLAPEVINRRGHGKALDWYLLGVALYEMLVGAPPYFSSNKNELFNNIQRGKLKIPSSLSPEAKSLIIEVSDKQLLQRDPNKRLGSFRDAEEVKEHQFFAQIDWHVAYNKGLSPPKVHLPEVPNKGIPAENIYGMLFTAESNKISGWSFVSD